MSQTRKLYATSEAHSQLSNPDIPLSTIETRVAILILANSHNNNNNNNNDNDNDNDNDNGITIYDLTSYIRRTEPDLKFLNPSIFYNAIVNLATHNIVRYS